MAMARMPLPGLKSIWRRFSHTIWGERAESK